MHATLHGSSFSGHEQVSSSRLCHARVSRLCPSVLPCWFLAVLWSSCVRWTSRGRRRSHLDTVGELGFQTSREGRLSPSPAPQKSPLCIEFLCAPTKFSCPTMVEILVWSCPWYTNRQDTQSGTCATIFGTVDKLEKNIFAEPASDSFSC